MTILEQDRQGRFVVFGSERNANQRPLIKLADNPTNNDYNDLLIYDQSGKTAASLTFPSDCSLNISWALSGDLNQDHVDDFVVVLKTSATGLGDHEYYVLFALSSKAAFQLTVLKSFDVDAEDFIDVRRNGHCQFILTSLIYPDHQLGIKHSYWTYDLLEAHGGQMRSANYLDHRFPSWIFYTNKPNHKASLPVSRAQSEAMLNARLRQRRQ